MWKPVPGQAPSGPGRRSRGAINPLATPEQDQLLSPAVTGIELIRSPALSDVAEYAYASRIDLSDAELIFTAGACPLDTEGAIVASAEPADLVAAWQVVRDGFGDHDPPSTLLGVAVLGYTDQLVEVTATALRCKG